MKTKIFLMAPILMCSHFLHYHSTGYSATFTLAHSSLPHWSPCLWTDRESMLPPQGLYICCTLCLWWYYQLAFLLQCYLREAILKQFYLKLQISALPILFISLPFFIFLYWRHDLLICKWYICSFLYFITVDFMRVKIFVHCGSYCILNLE